MPRIDWRLLQVWSAFVLSFIAVSLVLFTANLMSGLTVTVLYADDLEKGAMYFVVSAIILVMFWTVLNKSAHVNAKGADLLKLRNLDMAFIFLWLVLVIGTVLELTQMAGWIMDVELLMHSVRTLPIIAGTVVGASVMTSLLQKTTIKAGTGTQDGEAPKPSVG